MHTTRVAIRNAARHATRKRSGSSSSLNWSGLALKQLLWPQTRVCALLAPGHPHRLLHTRNLVEGKIIRSPLPDLEIPHNLPLHQMLLEKCDQFPERIAFEEYESGRTMTYAELKRRIVSVASALNRLGLVKGDVILVCSTNNMDSPVLNIACSALGVWYSTVNFMSLSGDICHYLNLTKPRILFCSPSTAPVAQQALSDEKLQHVPEQFYVFRELQGFPSFDVLLEDDGSAFPKVDFDPLNDIHALPFSSGTSGFPKGVLTKNRSVVATLMQFNANAPLTQDEVVLGNLPYYHMYGLIFQLLPILAGGVTVVVEKPFTPESFLSVIQDKRITFLPVVPPLLLFMAKSPVVDNYDLSSVRRVMCGAAPVGVDLLNEFKSRHPHMRFVHMYGMTEICLATTSLEGDPWDAVGHLAPNNQGKIVDPLTQEELGPYENGEFMMTGPQLTAGYFKAPEETAELLTADGWAHTGDIGYYNEDGCLFITDRLKEFIKYKGHQVAPAALEGVLLGHPDVQDAAVTRVPDVAAGELPKAFIVKKPGSLLTEQDFVDFVKEMTSPEKWLRGGVQFIDEIPKNPSGKILRRILRDKYIN